MKCDVDPGAQAHTKDIIGSAFDVMNNLGCGFLESVYKKVLYEELLLRGVAVQRERLYKLYYREKQVGFYVADLVLENRAIVELKTVSALTEMHNAQLVNHLRASKILVRLFINFGVCRLEWKRVVT